MRKRLAMLLIILIAAIGSFGCGKDETVKKTDDSLAVKTAVAQMGAIQREVTYSGTIKGSNEVALYPKVAARVVSVNKKEGDRVAAGETIISLDTTDYSLALATARTNLAQAESAYTNTKTNLDRTRDLYQQGAVSPQQMEAAELGLVQAKTALEQTRIAVKNANNTLANCRITSPISGVVGLVNITEGNMASPTAQVAMVCSLGNVKIEVNVSESDIGFISKENPVTVKVDSLGGKKFTGRVSAIAPAADSRTKAFPVEIIIDNSQGLLKSGMFAQVSLPAEQQNSVLTVPRVALTEKGVRQVVYVVDDKSVVHESEVKVGIQSSDTAQIMSGIKAGDKIVVKGQTLLHDGDKVRVVEGD